MSKCIYKRYARRTNTIVTSHQQTLKWINQANNYRNTTKQISLMAPETGPHRKCINTKLMFGTWGHNVTLLTRPIGNGWGWANFPLPCSSIRQTDSLPNLVKISQTTAEILRFFHAVVLTLNFDLIFLRVKYVSLFVMLNICAKFHDNRISIFRAITTSVTNQTTNESTN